MQWKHKIKQLLSAGHTYSRHIIQSWISSSRYSRKWPSRTIIVLCSLFRLSYCFGMFHLRKTSCNSSQESTIMSQHANPTTLRAEAPLWPSGTNNVVTLLQLFFTHILQTPHVRLKFKLLRRRCHHQAISLLATRVRDVVPCNSRPSVWQISVNPVMPVSHVVVMAIDFDAVRHSKML